MFAKYLFTADQIPIRFFDGDGLGKGAEGFLKRFFLLWSEKGCDRPRARKCFYTRERGNGWAWFDRAGALSFCRESGRFENRSNARLVGSTIFESECPVNPKFIL